MEKTIKLDLNYNEWYENKDLDLALCSEEVWQFFEPPKKTPKTIWITLSSKKLNDSHKMQIQTYPHTENVSKISFVGGDRYSAICWEETALVKKMFGKKAFYVRMDYV